MTVGRTFETLSRLDGKLAVVTGGSGWLGQSICDVFVELGADVVSVGRSRCHVQSVRSVTFDMSLDAFNTHIDETLTDCLHGHASVDILVNNMCSWPTNHDFMTTDITALRSTFDNNVITQLMFTQAIVRTMIETGTGGSIINIASMYGSVAPQQRMYRGQGGNALAYGAAKAAMIQSTKYLASLLGCHGIRVNSVSPGPFPRPGAFDGKQWFEEELQTRTMLGRCATPDELKGVVALLASDLGSYITGADIPVDGGWTAW